MEQGELMNLSNLLLQQENIIDHVTPSLSDNHLLMFCSDDPRVKYSARSHLDSMLHLHEKVVSRGPDRNSVLNTRLRHMQLQPRAKLALKSIF
jgi:hypothetical protein